jgi:hypothetical protein
VEVNEQQLAAFLDRHLDHLEQVLSEADDGSLENN